LNFAPLSPEELVTRLAAIVDSSSDAVIGTDVVGSINTWNAAAEQLLGYPAEEILGSSILLLIPPDLHQEHHANIEKLREGVGVMHYETIRLKKGGQRQEVSLAMSPIKNRQEEFIGTAVIARDVGMRRMEEAQRARLASIVESSDDAIIAKNLNGVVTDWNGAAERLFGYTAEEMVGRSIMTIIPPDLQHEEPMILDKIRNGERLEHYETQRLHKSGNRLDISLTISPIRDNSGRVIGASKIARDISERRRLENARMLLAAIVESSDDAIVSKNLDGIITSWNASAERLLGYTAEEIIGQSVLRIIPPTLHFEEPGIISRLRRGERIEHHETRRMRKDGQIIDVSLTVSPIRDVRGNVIGGSKILRDIRERKAAEAALVEKEKFVAAGRLAATLAHEVNNPLESITNLAYLLTRNDSLDAEARNFAELLLREVQRAGEITRETLGYYRQSRLPGEVNLEQVVEHVFKSKHKKLSHKSINFDISFREVSSIQGYSGELRQVFDNLIENAIDAVPVGGRVSVSGRKEEGAVIIAVRDNGQGIPPQILTKIFDPFFTTKNDKGSGLGLWVTRSIVEKHGGKISVYSDQHPDHHETVFTVELPTTASKKEEAASTSLPAQSATSVSRM
jgi:PAS domain S-box-containing protein